MSNIFNFARMLHNIWMKTSTSYAQKGWKFSVYNINLMLHPTFPQSRLPKPRILNLFLETGVFLFRVYETREAKSKE